MPALEIVVDVRDGQTMSQYKTPKNGKIKFHNADTADTLVISAKENAPWPFCQKDYETPKPLSVPPEEARAAWICNTIGSGEVLYTAKIGSALVEDPIIIFEKKKFFFDPVAAGILVFGVALGVAATLLYIRVRARRLQQG